jgi:hypothetical protein
VNGRRTSPYRVDAPGGLIAGYLGRSATLQIAATRQNHLSDEAFDAKPHRKNAFVHPTTGE